MKNAKVDQKVVINDNGKRFVATVLSKKKVGRRNVYSVRREDGKLRENVLFDNQSANLFIDVAATKFLNAN